MVAASTAAGPDGGVVVAGSLYVVGEVRSSAEVVEDAGSEVHLRYEAPRPGDDDDELDDSDDFDDPEGPPFA